MSIDVFNFISFYFFMDGFHSSVYKKNIALLIIILIWYPTLITSWCYLSRMLLRANCIIFIFRKFYKVSWKRFWIFSQWISYNKFFIFITVHWWFLEFKLKFCKKNYFFISLLFWNNIYSYLISMFNNIK